MGDRQLMDLCAELAEARRRIAAGTDAPFAALPALLTGKVAAHAAGGMPVGLVALLDELMRLIGQLELERADARARLAESERHRLARKSYTGGPAGR